MQIFKKDDDDYDDIISYIYTTTAAPRKSYSLTMFERRLIDEYYQTMHGSAVGLLLPGSAIGLLFNGSSLPWIYGGRPYNLWKF